MMKLAYNAGLRPLDLFWGYSGTDRQVLL